MKELAVSNKALLPDPDFRHKQPCFVQLNKEGRLLLVVENPHGTNNSSKPSFEEMQFSVGEKSDY